MVSAYAIEFNITRHCNNSCAHCNHGSPVAPVYFMNPETLRRDLAAIEPFIRVGVLSLQGGEPLLHKGIERMLEILDQSKIGKPTILTNGLLLDRVPISFWETMGRLGANLWISQYANLPQRNLDLASAKAKEHNFPIRICPWGHFTRIFAPQPNPDATYARCTWRRCLTIHEGWFYVCPQSAFFPGQFMGLDEHTDGLKLEGLTEKQFADFLARTTAPVTCSICIGATGEIVPWHQTFGEVEWKTEAAVPQT